MPECSVKWVFKDGEPHLDFNACPEPYRSMVEVRIRENLESGMEQIMPIGEISYSFDCP